MVHDIERQMLNSLNRHLTIGLLVIFLLAGGVGGWAAVEEINGAVIAPGLIAVETKTKRVQHQEGGIVKKIFVLDGDLVQAGDLLLKLDDTMVKARLGIIMSELGELEAQEARLIAERDELIRIFYPKALVARGQQEPAVASSLSGQRALREVRLLTLQGRKAQLEEQIAQLKNQIQGLTIQRSAKTENINLINERLRMLEPLLPQGLITASEITGFRRDRVELIGHRGELVSQIAQTYETISERRLQILQLQDEFRSGVLEDLQAVRARISQLHEEKITALDKLQRVDIGAPRTGYIHQLNVHTVGGVIGAGEILMLIVPREDVLIVEVQIQPTDVDQVQHGQAAVIRLPAFHQGTTPELSARVTTISADLTRDENTGATFYLARLTIGEDELAKLEEKKLVPGMPVEAFIQTGARTILSYLVKPLHDHLTHAFKE